MHGPLTAGGEGQLRKTGIERGQTAHRQPWRDRQGAGAGDGRGVSPTVMDQTSMTIS